MPSIGHFDALPLERVRWGVPAAEAVAAEAERLGAGRVFLIASRTLARSTDLVAGVRTALGDRCVGLFDKLREHTPIDSVLNGVTEARATRPDLLVSIGGGSVIDGVKVMQLCLSRGVDNAAELLALAGRTHPGPSALRQIAVPTTLSGGEYSSIAGATDPARRTKDMYAVPDMCARIVVLDAAATLHTPEWLWLSTAIRALDHAIEGYSASSTIPPVEAGALHAMKLFASSLRRTRQDPNDLAARQQSQMAVWLAATALGRVPMGASHGIGYILGTLCGVPHGYTSCVMLPAVLRWNERVTRDRQVMIAAALGMPNMPAADAVADLLQDLGLPRRLADVGVAPDKFGAIAAMGAKHPVVRSNPRPINGPDDVLEILKLAS